MPRPDYGPLLVLCGLLVWASAAAAPPPLHLEDLLAELASRSPELRARASEIRAARERPAQASAYEDPMLMVELWQVPISLQSVPLMFTLRQPIPWPGKLRARGLALLPEAERAQAERDSTARELRLRLSQAYYGYRLAIRAATVLNDSRVLLLATRRTTQIRYQVGRAELAEVLKLQEEAASLDTRLLDLERERDVAASQIRVLVDRPGDHPLGEPVTAPQAIPLPPMEILTAQALAQRSELSGARAALLQARRRIAAARAERAPDLAAWGGFMAMLGTPAQGEHTFTLGIQSTIPSLSLARSGAAAREAQAQAQAGEATLWRISAQICGEVREARLRLDTAERHLKLHRENLLPLSEQMVATARASYQTGRISLVLLLDALRALINHRLEYEQYQADYGSRLAELEAALGGPFLTAKRSPSP